MDRVSAGILNLTHVYCLHLIWYSQGEHLTDRHPSIIRVAKVTVNTHSPNIAVLAGRFHYKSETVLRIKIVLLMRIDCAFLG